MRLENKVTWYKVFVSEVEMNERLVLNKPRQVIVNGKKLCLLRTSEKVFALKDKCPHQGANLSDGFCRGARIVCPWHQFEFDLETGRGVSGTGDNVDTYYVECREDGVYVGFERTVIKLF